MCWIFAYNWDKNSIPILLEWLRNLEYRWYDSAWIACVNEKWKLFAEKSVWRVSNLATKIKNKTDLKTKKSDNFSNWIAHTRWATHWKVTEENTHPHVSNNGRFYVVHNWIIENYLWIKNLLKNKYEFYSDTDTEVIAKLIEEFFDWDLVSTLNIITKKLIWAYAIAVIDKNNPELLVGVKFWSPLIVWKKKHSVFLSSDINALSEMADEFITLDDNETVVIKNWQCEIFSLWKKVEKESETIDDNFYKSNIWDFETFTEKEINEIPEVIENVFKWRINFDTKSINNETLNQLNEYEIEKIEIVASGSSFFAGQVWTYWLKSLAWIETNVRISNEFLYDKLLNTKKTLFIFLSQSWETADVRECLKMVKEKWWLSFWIVNVVWSTIARMCDLWLYCHSWMETWVASTKNIVAQLAVLILISISLGLKRDLLYPDAKEIIDWLDNLKDLFKEQLSKTEDIKKIAKKYSKYNNFFYLWRNLLYWTAWECSLKLKELSYKHSECYSSWELKHWPLALVWDEFPCIILNPDSNLKKKNNSNIKEIKARNWIVLWVINEWEIDDELYDDYIIIPETISELTPFTPLIPMWLFAVYIAKELWRDIDKPQNLAKSVTVE